MFKAHYVVLGGGISGLSLAYRLTKAHPGSTVTLLEKSSRVGGWIETRHSEGFLFEMGPRSLRTHGSGQYTLRLVEELGLQEQVVTADPAAGIRYLYENNQLAPLPHNLRTLLFSSFLPAALKAAWKDWRIRPQNRPDESIFDFAVHHFGQEAAERFIDPLIRGIYASDSKELSLQASFPSWSQMEAASGSLLKAAVRRRPAAEVSSWAANMRKSPLFSFKHGLQTLVEALALQLDGKIRLNTSAKQLIFEEKGVTVLCDNGLSMRADHVFSTLPAWQLHTLLGIPELQQPTTSVATVCLGFTRPVLRAKGFGYLIAGREKDTILGTVWDSSVFPQQSTHPLQTRLTIMIDASTPKDFTSIALEAIQRHLGIKAAPDGIQVKVAKKAIPKYAIGHAMHMKLAFEQVQRLSPHLTVAGTAQHGVSVNDCIAHSFTL